MDLYQPRGASYRVQRRVAGRSSVRLDGLSDLLLRAQGRSVFDIGCNRGLVGFEFAQHGAAVVDGCDLYEDGVLTARELHADLRGTESRFEVVDLTGGPPALKAFVGRRYDITLCLATYHKLKRVMEPKALAELMKYFGGWTTGYFAWRGTSDKSRDNDAEIDALDMTLGDVGLARIHTSYISAELGVAAIWARK